ncbi:N-6 DNA methylase [Janthinobacterium sp. GW458P]|uniref:HsdM family class I SAM-dependent methyltransferase n=1 Tax=Janthinobacterium sp. GW458P TaxID=1981504 RepID=UPI000A324343|nr:N-6 DNA methylase [Janthinobacterium sp. GW458P]MBE3025976.1 N-6 DNA methylase [Janthinobacterium sp. GW458P]
MVQKIGAALLANAETIWKTADTLRGAGIKEGDFPSYMMPFFALMLLESRLRRFKAEKLVEFQLATGVDFDDGNQDHQDWLEAAAKAANKGYHPELLLLDKGLKETCAVPGGNFRNRLISHLNLYDPDTKRLLGLGYAEGTPKYLDIQGKASDLFSRPNSPLYAFAARWAAIDLTPFTNSEVTTIEEHIKRKWGDISAETAGEQYTPSDVIELSNDLVVEMWKRDSHPRDGIAKIYDMTCGGGNFLFASEDAMRDAFPQLSVRTYGQELNDTLFALSAIEARFRHDARIEHDNTLTNDLFLSEKFDIIVANPPYGGDWKDHKSVIEADASGRFAKHRMPPVSDGQLLFLQHAAYHLAERGIATVVHNGSTLFSGGAGGGESETRRWLIQELDLVEAIIQLPRGEFFNTDISTYVWVLNKAKPENRKGKVILINAEGAFTKLKRNLNKKNCEIDAGNRARIVGAFLDYADGPISRVMTVDQLLHNKVEILVRRLDEKGRSISEVAPVPFDEFELLIDAHEVRVRNGRIENHSDIASSVESACALVNVWIKTAARIDVRALDSEDGYIADTESGHVVRIMSGRAKELGLGRISIKAKATSTKKGKFATISVSTTPLLEKDFESTQFSSDPVENEELIGAFLSEWVPEPCSRVASKVGCDVNFNRVFPKPPRVMSSVDLSRKIGEFSAEMIRLQAAFEEPRKGTR